MRRSFHPPAVLLLELLVVYRCMPSIIKGSVLSSLPAHLLPQGEPINTLHFIQKTKHID